MTHRRHNRCGDLYHAYWSRLDSQGWRCLYSVHHSDNEKFFTNSRPQQRLSTANHTYGMASGDKTEVLNYSGYMQQLFFAASCWQIVSFLSILHRHLCNSHRNILLKILFINVILKRKDKYVYLSKQ